MKTCANIWRINIKTSGQNPKDFCIKNRIIGVGWAISKNVVYSFDEYLSTAQKEKGADKDWMRGWRKAVNAVNAMKIDDLVWTRKDNGIYFIGRITKTWNYNGADENRKADVINYCGCDLEMVGSIESVPGKVVNSFIPRATVQRVGDVKDYSMCLWNKIKNEKYYDFNLSNSDIFSLMTSDDCEDLISAYLQDQNYSLIASSCKKSTMGIEYALKGRSEGDIIGVQVKKGKVDINGENYKDFPYKVYLFSSHGCVNNENKNVVVLDKNKISIWMSEEKNKNKVPPMILNWMEIINAV
jgi:hypothetical protein